MRNMKLTSALVAAALMAVCCMVPTAFAISSDYASDVVYRSGYGPNPDVAASNVNDYINQDEQINLNKDAGTVKVLRTNQKALINDFVSAIIPLKNANPRELRGLARTITRKEGGDATAINDRVRDKYALHVVCPPFQIPYLVKTLQALDYEWVAEYNDGSATAYYQMKNREVPEDIIDNVLRLWSSPDFSYNVDTVNNSVLLFDQMVHPQIGWIEKTLDIPPSQITFDIKIYEVSNYNDLVLGVDFEGWKNGPAADLFRLLVGSYEVDTQGAIVDNWWRYASYSMPFSTAWIDMLRSKGEAKIVMETTLAVKSGSSGMVMGENGIVTFQQGNGGNPGIFFNPLNPDNTLGAGDPTGNGPNDTPRTNYNRPVSYSQTATTGFMFGAAPMVGLETAGTSIFLGMYDISGQTPKGAPIMSRRIIDVEMDVVDGLPFTIAGINKTTEAEETIGLPWLSKIPVIGKYVFGRTVKTEATNKIVAVVTPHFKVFSMDEATDVETVKVAKQLARKADPIENATFAPKGYDQWLLDD